MIITRKQNRYLNGNKEEQKYCRRAGTRPGVYPYTWTLALNSPLPKPFVPMEIVLGTHYLPLRIDDKRMSFAERWKTQWTIFHNHWVFFRSNPAVLATATSRWPTKLFKIPHILQTHGGRRDGGRKCCPIYYIPIFFLPLHPGAHGARFYHIQHYTNIFDSILFAVSIHL